MVKIKTNKPNLKPIIKAHKSLSKKKRYSKNWKKAKTKLQKRYQRLTNQKIDKKNKIVSFLVNNFQVVIQNDSIKSWQRLFGKKIFISTLGGIISGLKQHPHTLVVDRWFPSTKLCNECGQLHNISLKERVYKCDCGNEMDRDLHSAINILNEYFPTEHRKQIPEERKTSIELFEKLAKQVPSISVSFLDESGSPIL